MTSPGVSAPELGAARPVHIAAENGCVAAMAAATVAKTASAAAAKRATVYHWKCLDVPTPGARTASSVRLLTLQIPMDVQGWLGSVHEGFASWPLTKEDAPVISMCICVPQQQLLIGIVQNSASPRL